MLLKRQGDWCAKIEVAGIAIKGDISVKKYRGERLKTVLAGVGAAIVMYLGLMVLDRIVPSALAQSDQFLSRRVDQVEQRFYSIESRIGRIEQQQTRPAISPPIFNNSENDLSLLRSQVESLRLRVGEAECALLKLDERTLTPAARQVRARAAAAGTDVCRQDPGSPVRLSARP